MSDRRPPDSPHVAAAPSGKGAWPLRWASVEVITGAILDLNRSYRALPQPALRHWWRTIWVGIALVLALTAALVAGARALERAGMLGWEAGALTWMATALPVSFSMAMWLEGVGNGFVLWFVVLYAAVTSARAGRPLQTLAFLLGHTMAYLPIAFGWWLWDRPRPTLILDGLALPGELFHAFPSGHMVQSSFAIGLLLWLWLRSARSSAERFVAVAAYLFIICVIGFGRLRIGVHWPSDIVAGALIGGAWAVAVVRAVRWTARGGPSGDASRAPVISQE